MMQTRPRLSPQETYSLRNLVQSRGSRVLVIGDTHSPFVRDGYIDFLKDTYDKYNCNEVVHIGDLIDNHYSSYHETDPDGLSAGHEIKAIRSDIKKLARYFPNMKICEGNHDAIPNRKAFSAGLSKRWIKSIKDILLEDGMPIEGWVFDESFIIDDVLYTHGIGRKARQRGQRDIMSVVQGHYHSESYIEHYVGRTSKIWVMQVGCGIDDKAYAFAYGRHFNKSHINCGVVLEGGNLPILEYMHL